MSFGTPVLGAKGALGREVRKSARRRLPLVQLNSKLGDGVAVVESIAPALRDRRSTVERARQLSVDGAGRIGILDQGSQRAARPP